MKIAIPTDGNDKNAQVCMSYGRCPQFAVYDSDANTYSFLDNAANAAIGGAGIKASQMLADANIAVVLTPRIGENAYAVLSAAQIEVYKTACVSVAENVTAFLNGKLGKLTDAHAGFHYHGGN